MKSTVQLISANICIYTAPFRTPFNIYNEWMLKKLNLTWRGKD